MNKNFSKEDMLSILKWRALVAYKEATNESFVEWMTDLVKNSSKEEYSAHDVFILMNANAATTPVGEIKACIKPA